jgi:hypothetical protein
LTNSAAPNHERDDHADAAEQEREGEHHRGAQQQATTPRAQWASAASRARSITPPSAHRAPAEAETPAGKIADVKPAQPRAAPGPSAGGTVKARTSHDERALADELVCGCLGPV